MIEGILKNINEYEERASELLIQISELRAQVMEAYSMEKGTNEKIASISEKVEASKVPFVAYEMQLERHLEEKKDLLDRHEAEKDKMRKHYRNIILAITIPFTLFISMLIGTIIYIFSNYDIAMGDMDFIQDIQAGDNGTAIIEDGIEFNNTTQK